MQDSNPYSAPASQVADVSDHSDQQLADRGMRLGAAIIDGFINLAVMVPLMFAGGYVTMIMAGQRPGLGVTALWGLIGIVVLFVVQGYPLNSSGQTWGKKMLKMKIVDLDGNQPEFTRLFVLRYVTTHLIGIVPFVGGLYALVDVLFIFGEDQRCLHDRIAGTRVVVE